MFYVQRFLNWLLRGMQIPRKFQGTCIRGMQTPGIPDPPFDLISSTFFGEGLGQSEKTTKTVKYWNFSF